MTSCCVEAQASTLLSSRKAWSVSICWIPLVWSTGENIRMLNNVLLLRGEQGDQRVRARQPRAAGSQVCLSRVWTGHNLVVFNGNFNLRCCLIALLPACDLWGSDVGYVCMRCRKCAGAKNLLLWWKWNWTIQQCEDETADHPFHTIASAKRVRCKKCKR